MVHVIFWDMHPQLAAARRAPQNALLLMQRNLRLFTF